MNQDEIEKRLNEIVEGYSCTYNEEDDNYYSDYQKELAILAMDM